jgi:hypothetical protein
VQPAGLLSSIARGFASKVLCHSSDVYCNRSDVEFPSAYLGDSLRLCGLHVYDTHTAESQRTAELRRGDF